jgi:hypothetical protein
VQVVRLNVVVLMKGQRERGVGDEGKKVPPDTLTFDIPATPRMKSIEHNGLYASTREPPRQLTH